MNRLDRTIARHTETQANGATAIAWFPTEKVLKAGLEAATHIGNCLRGVMDRSGRIAVRDDGTG